MKLKEKKQPYLFKCFASTHLFRNSLPEPIFSRRSGGKPWFSGNEGAVGKKTVPRGPVKHLAIKGDLSRTHLSWTKTWRESEVLSL